jgi:phosphatidate cytidylyltransferase
MAPFLFFVYVGGDMFVAICAALSLCAVREFYKVFGQSARPVYWVAYVSVAALYIWAPIGARLQVSPQMFIPLWVFLVTVLCMSCLLDGKRETADVFITLAGIFYTVFLLFHAVMLAYPVPSPDTWIRFETPVWLAVFAAFGTDIFAYFTGSLLGKHKLCPMLSPKKTIEGAVGGVVGSALICGAFGYFAMRGVFVHCIVIGVLGGVVSQIGDLVASAIKRRVGVKDFGNLIPGHGGILDRIDSVLFTTPLVFWYVYLANALGVWLA